MSAPREKRAHTQVRPYGPMGKRAHTAAERAHTQVRPYGPMGKRAHTAAERAHTQVRPYRKSYNGSKR